MLLQLVYQDDCNLLELVQRLKRQNIKDFVVNQRRMRVKVRHPIVRSLWLQPRENYSHLFQPRSDVCGFLHS